MSAINATLIRDVVSEVMGRLGRTSAPPAKETCGCTGNGQATGGSFSVKSGRYGVFQDANEACAAAQDAFDQLRKKGVAARAKVVEIVKTLAEANAADWGRIELE